MLELLFETIRLDKKAPEPKYKPSESFSEGGKMPITRTHKGPGGSTVTQRYWVSPEDFVGAHLSEMNFDEVSHTLPDIYAAHHEARKMANRAAKEFRRETTDENQEKVKRTFADADDILSVAHEAHETWVKLAPDPRFRDYVSDPTAEGTRGRGREPWMEIKTKESMKAIYDTFSEMEPEKAVEAHNRWAKEFVELDEWHEKVLPQRRKTGISSTVRGGSSRWYDLEIMRVKTNLAVAASYARAAIPKEHHKDLDFGGDYSGFTKYTMPKSTAQDIPDRLNPASYMRKPITEANQSVEPIGEHRNFGASRQDGSKIYDGWEQTSENTIQFTGKGSGERTMGSKDTKKSNEVFTLAGIWAV